MKKIAFIGHSFHLLTKSSDFFITLLEKSFLVEKLFDDCWSSGKVLDLHHIDESYHAVVFFQMISPRMLKQIKCKNLVFVPMYDHSGDAPISFWYQLKNLKIICFSRTLDNMLTTLGFNTLNVQYYPDLAEKISGEPDTCFFWQRRSSINWDMIKTLLKNSNIKNIHIHKALDPGEKFIVPTTEEEIEYKIEYSEWFATKKEYTDVMNKSQIYISPRMYEGIGLSFLEAMAHGKVVIAANRPTMNEYILDGYNGFLFDPFNPKPLNLSRLDKISDNAFFSIREGHEKWNHQEVDIINFIDSDIRLNFYFERHPFARYRDLDIRQILKTAVKYILPYGIVKVAQSAKQGNLTFLRKNKGTVNGKQ